MCVVVSAGDGGDPMGLSEPKEVKHEGDSAGQAFQGSARGKHVHGKFRGIIVRL